MKKRICLLILLLAVLLSACNAASIPTTQQSLENNTTGSNATYPTVAPTTIPPVYTAPTKPTEPEIPPETTVPLAPPEIIVRPTDPEELVAESRTDGLNYRPSVHKDRPNSYLSFWFALDENCYPGMNITYDLSLSVDFDEYWQLNGDGGGSLYEVSPLNNGKTLSVWGVYSQRSIQSIVDAGGSMFLEAIIRADGYIVGYGIFEVGTDGSYCAIMRAETVVFPMIDGKLQEVTQEYAKQKIAEWEQEITPFDREAKLEEEKDYSLALQKEQMDQFYAEHAPTGEDLTIVITAPFDIYSNRPEEAGNVQLKITDDLLGYTSYPNEQYIPGYEVYNQMIIEPQFSGIHSNEGEIYLEARVNYSGFFTIQTSDQAEESSYAGKQVEFRYSIVWKGIYDLPEDVTPDQEIPERIWVDVVVRSREYLIGFLVFEIVPMMDVPGGYTLVFRYSEAYDFVNDRFQIVSKDFVWSRVEACHQYFMNNAE